MPEYLVHLVQVHENFRKQELQALADLTQIEIKFIHYAENSPFCVVHLPSDAAAKEVIERSILSYAIYSLWGCGPNLSALHASVQSHSPAVWSRFSATPYRFTVQSFQHKLPMAYQHFLINTFSYLNLSGPINMRPGPTDLHILIGLDYAMHAQEPRAIYVGRHLGQGARDLLSRFDLKKRTYISTTSFDAELALVTANIALAASGKVFYDPFCGTASLPLAASHYGAIALGSDLDGRTIRGKEGRNIAANFSQYNLTGSWLDSFVADLTNSPLRCAPGFGYGSKDVDGTLCETRWLDGIVCDPPYGVREGLQVLGKRGGDGNMPVMIDGKPAHLLPGYIPPRRPYSSEAMLDDILDFSAATLVDNGRLAIWIPVANAVNVEFDIPNHPCLQLISVCLQKFNNWSRRLLAYRRVCSSQLPSDLQDLICARKRRAEARLESTTTTTSSQANDLNAFRKKYFNGFRAEDPQTSSID